VVETPPAGPRRHRLARHGVLDEDARTVIFSGAGISGEAPAALPRGFGLRNDLLREIHAAAMSAPAAASLITDVQLDELIGSQRKLEVVLGRAWGTIGDDALGCLLTLTVEVPNEAHMLAAVHLARGGTHVTLNFDVGIEIAYDLLTGRAELPAGAPEEFSRLLPIWRRSIPAGTPPLRVAASRVDLRAWDVSGRPAALLKPHGSLTRDQTGLVDVVVVDIEELGQLAPGRRAAIDRVAGCDLLLITGYSGADPDVYQPLLDAAPTDNGRRTTWRCYSLAEDSPVRADTGARGIELVLGDPDGLATTALRDLLGLADAPPWPESVVPGTAYEERFRDWARRLTAAHPPELFAQAWAWLAADLGDLDGAEAIAARLADGGNFGARLRHAEILYTRAHGTDRDRAGRLFHHLGRESGADLATRAHCLLRAGDVARGRATRGKPGLMTIAHLARAFAEPARVLWITRNGRRDQESAADAYRAVQQTGLRIVERGAATAPAAAWPVLVIAARTLTAAGRRAEAIASNGNRRALVRQQRMMLTALAALLSGRPAPAGLDGELRRLHDAYRAADDLPGAGNCTAARAVVAVTTGDIRAGRVLLDRARLEYAWERHDRDPLPSGAALVVVLTRIIDRIEQRTGRR
jgi:hypothetical protein